MKIIFYLLTMLLSLSGCGALEHPVIPLSIEEKEFYTKLNDPPLVVDSVNRKVVIKKMFWVVSRDINIDIFINSDSLCQKDADIIAEKVAMFNSKLMLDKMVFNSCYLELYCSKCNSDASYSYLFKKDKYQLVNKSYWNVRQ